MDCRLISVLCLATYAMAQNPQPKARIVRTVDENLTVTLNGNVHPLISRATASKQAEPDTPMEHMILYLKSDAGQQAQLEQLLAQQNDPKSPLYHKFLTPEAFGAQFGAATADIAKVSEWLTSYGLQVEPVPAGNRAIIFNGTAAQVASAFKTEIRQYTVGGVTHLANATDPKLPEALSPTVGGIVKLHDFRHKGNLLQPKPLAAKNVTNPQYNYGGTHYLAPSDYGTIYDINPLYTAGINGNGVAIAVLARSNIYLSDMASFRSFAGLNANAPQIVLTNSDPGVLEGDSVETTLDTEWSGAVAPSATIKVIVSASTNSADGIDLSAQYAVSKNVAPIISLSYGSCEAFMGSSELAFYNSLWQQAAAQGQSVMVSAGDAGAAGCDGGSDTTGTYGKGINGLCSSPYSTCVGGTEFLDTTNPGQYWLSGNNPEMGSAIGYIPETVWNESAQDGGSGLWAGGGGVSEIYTKPSWQAGPGVPSDGKRDVPDISLTASGHDGYLIWLYGQLNSVGGTSASAPSFAGLMALVNQKQGARQGNVNTILYPLATWQAGGGAAVFHDVKAGNNSVPGVTGFSAGTGYDMGSGIGSVDANLLLNNWMAASATGSTTLSLSASSASLTVIKGQNAQTTLTSTAGSALKAVVTLSVSGAPSGVTATLASSTIPSPGSGSDVLTVAASSSAAAGTYTLTVTAAGGGQTAKQTISVVVPAPTFTLAASATSVSVPSGTSSHVTLTTTPSNGFSSAIALSVSGLPSGVTGSFSNSSVSGSAQAASVLTLTAAATTKAGSYTFTVVATGGGVTQTTSVTLVISTSANCTLAANPANITLAPGTTTTAAISCGSVTGTFSSALALSVSGQPAGVTPSLASSVAAGATTTLSLTATSTAAPGTYSLSIKATSGTFTGTLAIPVLVPSPTFTLAASVSSLTIVAGNSGQVTLTTTPKYGFNSAVGYSIAGTPSGVTSAFSSGILTFSVGSTAKAGSYPLTITGSGGGVSQSVGLTLVVAPPPSCTLASNPSSINLVLGSTSSASLTCGSVVGTFTGSMVLSVSGAPTGVTASLAAGTLAAGATTTLKLSASATAATPGSFSLVLHATGGGYTGALTIPVVIPTPSFALTTGATAVSILQGASGQVTIATTPSNGFTSPVSLSISGLPAGVTTSLSAASVSGASGGVSTLTFSAGSTAAGVHNVTITAVGAGITKTAALTLTVAALPICTLASNPTSVAITAGQSTTAQLSCGLVQGTFSGPLTLTLSGVPNGVTASTATGTLAVGSTTTLTISSAFGTAAGSYGSLSIKATAANYSQSLTIPISVSAANTFTVTSATASLTVKTGSTGQVSATSLHFGIFNSPVAFSASGLPAGVTASLSSATLPAPGDGTVTAAFTVGPNVLPGTYTINVIGTGGGVTRTIPVTLTVPANQGFTLQVLSTALTLTRGGSGSLVVSTGDFVGGFNSTIVLTVSGLAPGMNFGCAGATTGNNMVNLTYKFTAASGTALGTYPVTITASGAGITHTATVQTTVAK